MKRPVSFWIMIAVVAVLIIFFVFRVFGNNAAEVPPTSIPSVTASVVPSATVLTPTAKPSATIVAPTAKPSATLPAPTSVPTSVPSATSLPPTAIPTVNPIQNIIWQWVNVTDQSTNTTTSVPNPANYTISFYPDGTLSGKADCNTFNGSYSQNNGFSIKIGTSTTAACGEGSLDQEYMTLLRNVASGCADGSGNLALETAGGAQRMFFNNGGATAAN
jgi:heat shock protein HslJ